tara:strand:+ start:323 stop:772 length:450 start_codon:yes stop_codon:yes gene_type:complete
MNNNRMGECYICIEGDAKLSPCNCKNMYIHDECLLELISKTNSSECKVCKEEFKNVNVTVKVKRQLTNYGKTFILFMSLNGIFVVFFVYNSILYILVKHEIYIVLLIFFGIMSIMSISYSFELLKLRRGIRQIIRRRENRIGIINDNIV